VHRDSLGDPALLHVADRCSAEVVRDFAADARGQARFIRAGYDFGHGVQIVDGAAEVVPTDCRVQ
jgi:hypothetical protein